MILAGPIQDDSLPGDLAGERLRSTFGASIAATAADTFFHNPLSALERNAELERAEGFRKPRFGPLGAVVPQRLEVKQIAPQEANERFGDLGLTFDEPVSEEALGIIVRRKREEITRLNILRRGPQGVIPMGAKFLTSLAVSVIDPINVASAFIPVVGEARIASLVARFGKNSARFRTGLIEGAVGAAAVEPIILSAAANDQSDYTALDSLLNVTIGSILGGGLHVGVGKISDRLKAAAPETREAALRGSVAQMAEGRPVDAATILRTDPAMHETGPILKPLVEAAERVERSRARVSSLETEQTQVEARSVEAESLLEESVALQRLSEGETPELIARQLDEQTGLRLRSIEDELDGVIPAKRRRQLEAEQRIIRASIKDEISLAQARAKAESDAVFEIKKRVDAEIKQAKREAVTRAEELDKATRNAAKADRRFEALLDQSDTPAADVSFRLRDLVDRVGDELDVEARSRIAEASRRSADAATTPDPELGARASENARETELRVQRGEADDLDAELADLQTEVAGLEGAEGVVDDVAKIVDDAEQTGELARVAGRCLMRG